MGLRTWNVHLHRPGRRVTDAGQFLGTYQDIGGEAEDEPDIGCVIYLDQARYEVVHFVPDGTTGGTLIVEPSGVTTLDLSTPTPIGGRSGGTIFG